MQGKGKAKGKAKAERVWSQSWAAAKERILAMGSFKRHVNKNHDFCCSASCGRVQARVA